MTKKRKQYSTDEKMAALRQHLLEKQPVSDVCDMYGLQPTVFYRWQKQLFERGGEALRSSRDTETTSLRRQITQLEKKLIQKDHVLGEVMEEYVALHLPWRAVPGKKALGAP